MRCLIICLAVTLFYIGSFADHLMGGEITYEHISNKKYRVKVTLYRDCNDCKFAGDGGGNSTNNCSDLTQAFIRTTTTTCGDKNIGSIPLTKSGFENITETCIPDNSRCGTSPKVPYGIEAHYYSGTVDFEQFTTYSDCVFQLFIHKAERSNNLTSIASEQAHVYTYALINPWKEQVSSPFFAYNPRMVFQVNRPAYATAHAKSQSGDSLYYSWGTPQTNYNAPINYASGYSATNWMTGYCSGAQTNCIPDPVGTPPAGLFLNNHTGDFVVTPALDNEKTIRVVEVEQWRKMNGSYYLAGKIRREAITMVVTAPTNNPPTLAPNLTYTLCVGQSFSDTLIISDIPTTSLVSDSVHLDFEHDIDGLVAKEMGTTDAPYVQAILTFTPLSSQVGIHYLSVRATDNQCPVYASSSYTIKIEVVSKPTVTVEIDQQFCGFNEITVVSDRTLSTQMNYTNGAGKLSEHGTITFPYTLQDFLAGNATYAMYYTDNLGCSDSIKQQTLNSGKELVKKVSLIGKLNPCYLEKTAYHLQPNGDSVSATKWQYNTTEQETDTLLATPTDSILRWRYTLTKNGIQCPMTDSVLLTIVPSPTLDYTTPSPICFLPVLDLSAAQVQPADGQWYFSGQPISSLFDLSTLVHNTDTTLQINYSVRAENTGCTTTRKIPFSLKKSPTLELRGQSVCGETNVYYLSNAIKLPYAARDRNIAWKLLDNEKTEAIMNTPRPVLNIPELGIGTYKITATNSMPNGCTAVDTALITVTDNLEIHINNRREICEDAEPISLNEVLNTSVDGGFWESSIADLTDGTTVNPSIHCGETDFRYVYDRNNCYATVDVQLTIVCKPTFELSIPDSICTDAETIELDKSYMWKDAEGYLVSQLNPSQMAKGKHLLKASTTKNTCTFDATRNLTVLSPITVQLSSPQEQLCQGDTLYMDVAARPYSTLTLTNCVSTVTNFNREIYIPDNCDLSSGIVSIVLNSQSMANCPSHSASLDIPYFKKPAILLPPTSSLCEPFLLADAALPEHTHFELSSSATELAGTLETLKSTSLYEGDYNLIAHKTDENGCENRVYKNNFLQVHATPTSAFSMGNDNKLTLSKREISLYNYSSITKGTLRHNWYYKKLNETITFSTAAHPTYWLPADTGVFHVSLVSDSDYGCTDTTTQTVVLVPDIVAFIPNAFTPNHKGPKENAVFRVTSDHAQEYRIDIYNKWGQKVYASNTIEEAWDGTYKGSYCQNGVYVYAIVLVNKAGLEYTYQGTVNLIR